MEFRKELEKIKESENKQDLSSFEEAKNQALAEFRPKYDEKKSMYENGKDIARTIGLNEALKDANFINRMKEGSQKEIETDLDTDQKNAEIENQKAFYKKHKPVLSFARMEEPCGLSLMKWTFAIAVVPYILSLIVGEIFNLIAKFFECINSLFNAIIGIPEYLTNKETGELVLDEKGNPITKGVKVNLLTKIIFWFVFVLLCLVIVFAIVKAVTGFDIINSIKNLIS